MEAWPRPFASQRSIAFFLFAFQGFLAIPVGLAYNFAYLAILCLASISFALHHVFDIAHGRYSSLLNQLKDFPFIFTIVVVFLFPAFAPIRVRPDGAALTAVMLPIWWITAPKIYSSERYILVSRVM